MYPQYPFEWTEGKITLILDIAVNDIDRKNALLQVRQFLKAQQIVAYTKKSVGKCYIKKQSRFHLLDTMRFDIEDVIETKTKDTSNNKKNKLWLLLKKLRFW